MTVTNSIARLRGPIHNAVNALLGLFKSVDPQQLTKAVEDLQDTVETDAPKVGNGTFQQQLMRVPTGDVGPKVEMSGAGTDMIRTYSEHASGQAALVTAYIRMADAFDRTEESRKSEYLGLMSYVEASAPRLGMPEVGKAAAKILADAATDDSRKARLLDIADTLKSVMNYLKSNAAEAAEGDDVTKAIQAAKSLQSRVDKALAAIESAKADQSGAQWATDVPRSKVPNAGTVEDEGNAQEATKSLSLSQVFDTLNNRVNPPPSMQPAATTMKAAIVEDSYDHLSPEEMTELQSRRARRAWERATGNRLPAEMTAKLPFEV